MSSKAAKLFNQVRICECYNRKWHDFIMQKNHLFGEDKDGYFVTAGEPNKQGRIKVYRCKGVPSVCPDFFRWYPTYEAKGSELYNKIMQFKSENPNLKVTFKPLDRESHLAPCKLRQPSMPKPFKHPIIPGGASGRYPTNIITVNA